ncbi:MAG: C_GCAxxG_C_C family protein [Bacteroidales bacterium]|nr:C_GCAxxG_C_C family protein [Bacteroidales bacterium]
MAENGISHSLSRREFARKSLIAAAGIGAISLAGYGFYNKKKLRSLNNLLRMGHCAPSVMQTLTDLYGIDSSNLVLYAGAMAGGIAGSDMECGALTAPLMFMSSRTTDSAPVEEKLRLINISQAYYKEFINYNNAFACRIIQGNGISSCMKAVCGVHQLRASAISDPGEMSEEKKEALSLLMCEFENHSFHCAQNVLKNLSEKITLTKELLQASWIFTGGIAMMNRTCGALAGGVMALSAATASIEQDYSRVARMTWLLMHNKTDEAMKDEVNSFNRSIRLSEELGNWFRKEFGSTSCNRIWGYDFAKTRDVENFINGSCIKHCKNIAEKVAEKVSSMI